MFWIKDANADCNDFHFLSFFFKTDNKNEDDVKSVQVFKCSVSRALKVYFEDAECIVLR